MSESSEINKSLEVRAESFKNSASAIINLFQIDLKEYGSYFFHAGENGFNKKLKFNKQDYQFIPLETNGFEQKGDGGLPRPRLTISNYHGFLSLKMRRFEDFIGYKVTRIKTFTKFLDAENFPNNVNPYFPHDDLDNMPEELGSHFPKDEYFINQKVKETSDAVQFELTSILELGDVSLPSRVISPNACTWLYRGSIGCQYDGVPVADSLDKKIVPGDGYTPLGYSDSQTDFDNDQNQSLIGYKNGVVKMQYYALDVPLSSGSYGLSEISDSGIWNPGSGYSSGDYVRIPSSELVGEVSSPFFYVCVSGTNIKTDPRKDSAHWAEDACSKNILGCRLRFGNKAPSDKESSVGLPFGAFPGVNKYDQSV